MTVPLIQEYSFQDFLKMEVNNLAQFSSTFASDYFFVFVVQP